jgi:hypothetical protein
MTEYDILWPEMGITPGDSETTELAEEMENPLFRRILLIYVAIEAFIRQAAIVIGTGIGTVLIYWVNPSLPTSYGWMMLIAVGAGVSVLVFDSLISRIYQKPISFVSHQLARRALIALAYIYSKARNTGISSPWWEDYLLTDRLTLSVLGVTRWMKQHTDKKRFGGNEINN